MFGDGTANVAAWGSDEMKVTEGEFLFKLIGMGAKVIYRNWRTGGRTYKFGYHNAHNNFGTRKKPSWRYHFQWNTTHGTYRVPVWRSYTHKYNGGKPWWR